MQNELSLAIEKERQGPAYQNYLEVRDAVLEMIAHEPHTAFAEPSAYWQEELAGFEYMLDASPLLIKNLRHHCYHLTGVRDWEYRQHHVYHTAKFKEHLEKLRSQDSHVVCVPESPALGGFGYIIDGALYNADTIRFYDALLALDRAHGLDHFRQPDGQKIVAEVGAGWGGFAYQFKTLFPQTTYIVVDFPSTILFSGTYLKTVFPNARTLFLNGSTGSIAHPEQYDFIFVPHYLWTSLQFKRPDLIVNLASFQEMKTAQMDQYVEKARDWGIPLIYSVNHERNFGNLELGAVSEVLGRHYVLREVGILEKESRHLNVRKAYLELKHAIKTLLGRPTKVSKPHFLGVLK